MIPEWVKEALLEEQERIKEFMNQWKRIGESTYILEDD